MEIIIYDDDDDAGWDMYIFFHIENDYEWWMMRRIYIENFLICKAWTVYILVFLKYI